MGFFKISNSELYDVSPTANVSLYFPGIALCPLKLPSIYAYGTPLKEECLESQTNLFNPDLFDNTGSLEGPPLYEIKLLSGSLVISLTSLLF